MSLAFSVADKMLIDKKINFDEYNSLIDDIKKALNISEQEHLEIIDKSWTDNKKVIPN